MLDNLIITYKEIAICVTCLAIIIQLLKVALTYWEHYVTLMRVLGWFKFTSYCILFLVLLVACLIF